MPSFHFSDNERDEMASYVISTEDQAKHVCSLCCSCVGRSARDYLVDIAPILLLFALLPIPLSAVVLFPFVIIPWPQDQLYFPLFHQCWLFGPSR